MMSPLPRAKGRPPVNADKPEPIRICLDRPVRALASPRSSMALTEGLGKPKNQRPALDRSRPVIYECKETAFPFCGLLDLPRSERGREKSRKILFRGNGPADMVPFWVLRGQFNRRASGSGFARALPPMTARMPLSAPNAVIGL